MSEGPGRHRALIVAIGVVVMVLLLGILLLTPRQTRGVATPDAQATPEEVVATHLAALDAHDCDTAEAVMTPRGRDTASSWCEDVARVSDVVIGRPHHERPRDSGRSPSEEVVNVPVTFDLAWRLFHDDGSMDEGPTDWGYLLVRSSPGSPWRIFDQGMP